MTNTQPNTLTEEELQNAERYNAAGRFALKDVSYPPPYDRRNELLGKLIAAARKGIEAQKLVSDIRQIIQCAGAIRGDIEDRLNVYSPPEAQEGATEKTRPLRDKEGPEDHLAKLVAGFAEALLLKLRDAEKKYGYSDGWLQDGWADDLRRDIRLHVDKGDPRDVAAYCAFAWHHGWSLSLPSPTDSGVEDLRAAQADRDRLQREVERLACLVKRAYNEGFLEGMDEVKRDRGGKSWGESKSRTALIGEG